MQQLRLKHLFYMSGSHVNQQQKLLLLRCRHPVLQAPVHLY